MTSTFLVSLNIADYSDKEDIAADISDSLRDDGFEVTSVKPWASHGEVPQPDLGFSPPLQLPPL